LALRLAVVEPASEVSAADKPEIKDFYAVGRAKATEAEVHLFALFIIGLGLSHARFSTCAVFYLSILSANGYRDQHVVASPSAIG
jgi:hypothetical protein